MTDCNRPVNLGFSLKNRSRKAGLLVQFLDIRKKTHAFGGMKKLFFAVKWILQRLRYFSGDLLASGPIISETVIKYIRKHLLFI